MTEENTTEVDAEDRVTLELNLVQDEVHSKLIEEMESAGVTREDVERAVADQIQTHVEQSIYALSQEVKQHSERR